MFMLLAALALASCSDSSSNYMTQSQYTLVCEILDFADSAAYAGVTMTDGDTWVTFIDSDGDGELDDDETVIYKETVTNSFSGVDDEDQTYVLEKTYDYEDSYGDSVAGTYPETILYSGYAEYWTADESTESGYKADTYSRYITEEYDLSATIDGKAHTLKLKLCQTRVYVREDSVTNLDSRTYTSSSTVLDGSSLKGYEDYKNY